MLRNLGGGEILIILVIVMLLFGANRLPDMARSLGQSAKEFSKGLSDGLSDTEEAPSDDSL